jgi:hypothetical protein
LVVERIMSIVGGLVGSEVEKLHAAKHNALGEWAVRNAWALVLIGSVVFWLALGGVLAFG